MTKGERFCLALMLLCCTGSIINHTSGNTPIAVLQSVVATGAGVWFVLGRDKKP